MNGQKVHHLNDAKKVPKDHAQKLQTNQNHHQSHGQNHDHDQNQKNQPHPLNVIMAVNRKRNVCIFWWMHPRKWMDILCTMLSFVCCPMIILQWDCNDNDIIEMIQDDANRYNKKTINTASRRIDKVRDV